ncbi:hypothetical protein ACHAXS_012411 [Conticribra weissflogii]
MQFTTDADNDLDDSDNEIGTTSKTAASSGGGGLFDSSDEEDDDAAGGGAPKKLGKKKKATKPAKPSTKSKSPSGPPKSKMSMKERMEALAKKRAAADGSGTAESAPYHGKDAKEPKKKRPKTDGKSKGGEGKDGKEGGYESGDSYDSVNFQRTKEDDDFIDADDEDPDALKELYAEQHFEDERPDGSDSENEEGGGKGKKKKGKGSGGGRGGGKGGLDKLSDDEGDVDETADATSALKAAVKRMAKKKKEAKKLNELEDEARAFLEKMTEAADADDASIAARKPATKKLAMLPQVLEMLAKKDMIRPLLDLELLSVCKRWVQPLPNGSLGNVTLRHRIIEAISGLTGETGVNASDLKRSGFGKVVMTLYMHKSETPAMKKMLKNSIEQWSRPIFQKSGNMKDLERVQASRRDRGLVGISLAQKQMQSGSGSASKAAAGGKTEDDLNNIISGRSKAANEIGNNRVRVPYSKGFQFTVRPMDRTGNVADKRNLVSASKDNDKRNALSKRMTEKQRPTNKQGQRSANISIEGRAVK